MHRRLLPSNVDGRVAPMPSNVKGRHQSRLRRSATASLHDAGSHPTPLPEHRPDGVAPVLACPLEGERSFGVRAYAPPLTNPAPTRAVRSAWMRGDRARTSWASSSRRGPERQPLPLEKTARHEPLVFRLTTPRLRDRWFKSSATTSLRGQVQSFLQKRTELRQRLLSPGSSRTNPGFSERLGGVRGAYNCVGAEEPAPSVIGGCCQCWLLDPASLGGP